MRLLLDTHAFLWWVFADPKLSRRARTAIDDDIENNVFVSTASAWEISTKYRIGKLPDARVVAEDVPSTVAAEGFAELAISMRHAQRAGNLIGHHQDPFDRMLIAQALAEDLSIATSDTRFAGYKGLRTLWD